MRRLACRTDSASPIRPFARRRSILAGTASLRPNELGKGSYYGGRRPEDGRIDWRRSAREIHNLVRAVAPPYPGAFCDRLKVYRTQLAEQPAPGRAPGPFRGHVVDMISAFAPYAEKFAVFNIADSCLTVGVCLAVLLELMGRQRDGSKAVRKKAEPAR